MKSAQVSGGTADRSERRRWRVSGRVQGVYFRAHTRKQAQALELSGHAINLPDGRVEVVAAGSVASLEALERWLHRGSPAARVEQVESMSPPETVPPGFLTG